MMQHKHQRQFLFLLLLLHEILWKTNAFSVLFMARRGRGNLKRSVEQAGSDSPSSTKSLNKGKGQEITGVTLPAEGKLKGWEFGENVRMVCANVNGRYYALQGNCPRCGFDLWKGTLINDDSFEDIPRVACPTCSTTFGFRNGKKGPPLKRSGLQGFVGSMAQTATVNEKDAKAFQITRDETDGRVYCRER